MSKAHLVDQCQQFGDATRKELAQLCEGRSSVVGGGKKFWAASITSLGVFEKRRWSSLHPRRDIDALAVRVLYQMLCQKNRNIRHTFI
jgi:hypothetical protein